MLLKQSRVHWPNLDGVEPIQNWPQGRPLRVLLASDALHSTTGYGKQAVLIVAALHRLGVAVAFLNTYGLSGAHFQLIDLPGVKVYGGGAEGFANDVIQLAYEDWKADILITLKDTPVFKPEVVSRVRWAPLTPIDHEPIPPAVSNILRLAWWPIAYAPNGFRAMRKIGLDPLYAPHAFNPEIYHPRDRVFARRELGWPIEPKIVATVAVNRGGLPSRKAWPQLFEAMGIVRKEMGDCAPLWYCHTSSGEDGFEGGINLLALAHAHGVADRIIFPEQRNYRYAGGVEETVMANIYRAADLLLAPSLGEGFGVPIVESQACGTPALGGRWAATEDLLWTEPQLGRNEAVAYYDQQASNVFIPQPKCIAEHVMTYLNNGLTEEDYQNMVSSAQEFRIDHVTMLDWTDVVLRMAKRIANEDRWGRGILRIIRPEEVLS